MLSKYEFSNIDERQQNILVIPSAKNYINHNPATQLKRRKFTQQHLPFEKASPLTQTIFNCRKLSQKQGAHSNIAMQAAGFRYTGVEDTARCDTCGLEVSNWTLDMKPFSIHTQQSPECAFVRSLVVAVSVNTFSNTTLSIMNKLADDHEKPSKRQKLETDREYLPTPVLVEVDKLKRLRKRTFSHWSQRMAPSSVKMAKAGFFSCNVGDRVICLYCNLICQNWNSETDDPCAIHKALSPRCPYVIAMTNRQDIASILILNGLSTNTNIVEPICCDEIVHATPCHTEYMGIPRRQVSFETWPNENLPLVDELVRAGFFYTGSDTTVTCFYCGGSLQNWSSTDNPTVEHARWFPNCAYIKQLCGPDLYRKVQELKKAQEDEHKPDGQQVGRGLLNVTDESLLSRLVAARLDLTVSQRLLDENYRISIIKRCWEDQLRLKRDDFLDDCELYLSCVILDKQIRIIDGRKENITIPYQAMKELREKEQQRTSARVEGASTSTPSESNVNDADVSESRNMDMENSTSKVSVLPIKIEKQTENLQLSNPCVRVYLAATLSEHAPIPIPNNPTPIPILESNGIGWNRNRIDSKLTCDS
ncbi:unnamed protein product [Adineta ricciae]|uniref:Uncharacterized protein n=1 Tax=Adineta ricciae TaxID=249248 RepID=A0A814CZ14_ADIRI|nr:unnamed protein product [Adineta ricciae]CAF0949971.1 unnamed protein product [Adineta ricciae]